jgi:uncharacterized membrane protein YhaH (DUF805 family)
VSTDLTPGWDAIDAALARLYPGLGDVAPHFGRSDARMPGQGIWGITAYPNTAAPQPHWHLVTYGFSNVFDSDPTSDEHDAWADFEWTFRVAADIDLTQPLAPQVPTWSLRLLQWLGDLVFSGSDALDLGHRIKVGGPITLGQPETDLTAIMFGEDPQLTQIDTGFGRLRFVQLVGVTDDTVAAAQSLDNGVAGTLQMLEAMAASNPLLITDINQSAATSSEGTPFVTQPEWPSEPVGATDPRDLTLPLYGATFGQAVSRFFRSYARFSGRASRSEYWWAQLAVTVVALLCVTFVAVAGDASALGRMSLLPVVVFVLVCAIPGWALLVRRLHDTDLSGWLSLLYLLPYVGFVIPIVVGVLPAKPYGERFDRR